VDKEKEKYLQLFNYLFDFAKLREKIIRKVDDYEECIWFNEIPDEEGYMCITFDKFEDKERSDWIKIKKPKEPKFPPLPLELNGWIDVEKLWDYNTIPVLNEIIEDNGKVITIDEKPDLKEIFKSYLDNQWIPWSKEEANYQRKAELYKKFFNIYEKSKKFGEEFELVVGLGLLYFQLEDSIYIKRHILVANATLDFLSDKGIFTVNIGADGAKLRVETEMLQDLEFGNVSTIHKELERKLEEQELIESPFSKDLHILLESFVNRLHHKSNYFNTLKIDYETPKIPTIFYAPALILRKRTLKSLSALYQNIIDTINNTEHLNLPLIDDLTETNQINDIGEIESKDIEDGLYTDIFFPKVYNDEQIQILDRLRTRNKILVQGPPGTGKSHTIANLISHLLAHGKTILITAHTKRALTVLKNHLPDDIKPLCVNLLGNDSQSVNDLESSVVNIIKRFDGITEQEYKKIIDKLSTNLIQAKKKRKELEENLLLIKEFDTRKHEFNEYFSGSLLEISKKIRDESKDNDWFQDKIEDYDKSIKQINSIINVVNKHHLYNGIEREFEYSLYNKELIPVKELQLFKSSEITLTNFENTHRNLIDRNLINDLDNLKDSQINELENLFVDLLDIKKAIVSCKLKWSEKALDECINGYSNFWIGIYETTTQVHSNEFIEKVEFFEKLHKFDYPKDISKKQIGSDLNIFINYLESGKKLRRFKILNNKEIKERWYLNSSVFVNGSLCDTLEEYKLLREHINLELEIENLENIWSDKLEKQSNNYLQFLEIEKNRLELEKIIELSVRINDSMARIIKICGEDYVSLQEDSIKKIISNIEFIKLIRNHESSKLNVDKFIKELSTFIEKNNAHVVYSDILKIVKDNNISLYENYLDKINLIKEEYKNYFNYKKDKLFLKNSFPILIEELINDNFDYNLINEKNLQNAISWSHAKTKIGYLLESDSYQNTLDDLSNIESKISKITSELASERAWYFLFKNMTVQHRKHLVAWFQAIKKIGKGTGKNAWKFRKEAQKQMDQCRTAIPAWIMPLYRITETIKPIPGMFDYIIIDEASQAGPDALFLLFIAKKIIIVGDDKQTAPEYLGINKDSVNQLIQKHLKNFPFDNFYGLESSFYDLAKIFIESGGGKVTLREHFRCMPEIIEFSNRNFYEPFGNSLFPLKQYSEKRLEPIKTTFVSDGLCEGTSAIIYNLPEAEAICKTIEKCIKDEQYKDKTIGVISLRGLNQAQRLEKMLLDRLGPEELEKRKIICGNSAYFQGDERDVIFLSMVVDGIKNFRALTTDPDKRRFNVAASRAKEQVWLFHSVHLEDLVNKEDLRYLLLDYYLNPKTYTYPTISLPNKFDYNKEPPNPFGSWFEVEIFNDLSQKGYHLVPQYPVSKYRIDLGLIFPNGLKIAIECDGDKYHGIEEYQNDIMRQKVLERCGWQFIRIRGCEYYSDKIKSLNKTLDILNNFDGGQEQNKYSSENKISSNSETFSESKLPRMQNENPILSTEKELIDKQSSTNKEVSNNDSALLDWFINMEAETWFNISHIAKDKNLLSPMERNFAYSMGKYLKSKWNPSIKQLNYARKIYEKINKILDKDNAQEKLRL
jgi:very-short-patch-repair endonuclease